MLNRIIPNLTKIPGSRCLWRRFPIGLPALRVSYGTFSRPHDANGVYAAADLARRLKIDKISVIDFGVARGQGLLAVKPAAEEVSRALNFRISVNRRDAGNGYQDQSITSICPMCG